MDEESFKEAVRHAKIPVLVLDQKWHRLFALSGKPDDVKALEQELNELLAEQGKLNNEQKELKKLKNRLMNNIVQNIDHAGDDAMAQDKRLIDETNAKIEANEDELLSCGQTLPRPKRFPTGSRTSGLSSRKISSRSRTGKSTTRRFMPTCTTSSARMS